MINDALPKNQTQPLYRLGEVCIEGKNKQEKKHKTGLLVIGIENFLPTEPNFYSMTIPFIQVITNWF